MQKNIKKLDLKTLVKIILKNKYLILVFVLIFFVAGQKLFNNSEKLNFEIDVNVYPIKYLDNANYNALNSISKFKIEANHLFDMYIEKLIYSDILLKAALELKLLDSSKYPSDNDYLESVKEFVKSITIRSRTQEKYVDKIKWSIVGNYNNRENWIAFIKLVDEMANKLIQKELQEIFNKYIETEKTKKVLNIKKLITSKLESVELIKANISASKKFDNEDREIYKSYLNMNYQLQPNSYHFLLGEKYLQSALSVIKFEIDQLDNKIKEIQNELEQEKLLAENSPLFTGNFKAAYTAINQFRIDYKIDNRLALQIIFPLIGLFFAIALALLRTFFSNNQSIQS